MTLELKGEQEAIVAQAIDAGVISGADDVLQLGVEAVKRRLEDVAQGESSRGGEWGKSLHRWISSHATDAPLLSDEAVSRESVYDTHG
jgi:hypothetical protein